MSEVADLYVMNPKTSRYVKRSSRIGQRLLKSGAIKPIKPKPPPEPEPVVEIPPQPVEAIPQPNLRRMLTEASSEMIAENRSQLENTEDLSDKQVDKLLKKLLYEKLCVSKPSKSKARKAKLKAKKKAKRRFKIREPSSSEESDSDSD
jgi:hypothetical protein